MVNKKLLAKQKLRQYGVYAYLNLLEYGWGWYQVGIVTSTRRPKLYLRHIKSRKQIAHLSVFNKRKK